MPEQPEKPTARAASAGGMIVGTILLCAGIGAGVGAAFGAAGTLAVAGLLIGFPVGILVVRARFRDL